MHKKLITKDKLGIILSVGCLVHCLLMPLILPLFPLIGFGFNHGPWLHIILGSIIIVVAAITFVPGFRRHNSFVPMVYGSIGIYGIFVGGLFEYMKINNSVIPTIIGSLFLIIAHYINHKYLCLCEHHK